MVPGKSIYGPGKNASNLKPGEQIADYFNRDAFAQPAPGTFGNLPRNAAVGPPFRQIDLANDEEEQRRGYGHAKERGPDP